MLHVVYSYAYAAMTHTATAAAAEGYGILQIVLAQQALQVFIDKIRAVHAAAGALTNTDLSGKSPFMQ